MPATVYQAMIRWSGVSGSTLYEIWKDGKKVATAGPKARTTKVSIDDSTIVQIIDIPKRSYVQEVKFNQETSP